MSHQDSREQWPERKEAKQGPSVLWKPPVTLEKPFLWTDGHRSFGAGRGVDSGLATPPRGWVVKRK